MVKVKKKEKRINKKFFGKRSKKAWQKWKWKCDEGRRRQGTNVSKKLDSDWESNTRKTRMSKKWCEQMWEYQKRIHNGRLRWKVYIPFWIGWVIGLEAGGKEDKTGILASSNEYWMLLNEYWFSAPSFLLGQNCAIFSSVRVTACNTTGWQSTSKLKLGQLKG